MTQVQNQAPVPEKKELTKEEQKLIRTKREVSAKLLKIFNDEMFSVNDAERNVQIFKSGIQNEFFKLKYTKKVKDLGIKVVPAKEKSKYDAKHNEILKSLKDLPIFLAESVLEEFLMAIEGKMREKKFKTKFNELKLEISKDE